MITLLVSLEKQEDEQVDTVVEIKKSGTVLEAIIEVFCSSFFYVALSDPESDNKL
jgi:hypothetical protein